MKHRGEASTVLRLHTWTKLSGCRQRLPCGISSFLDPASLELAMLEAPLWQEIFPGDHNWAVRSVVSRFLWRSHILQQRGSELSGIAIWPKAAAVQPTPGSPPTSYGSESEGHVNQAACGEKTSQNWVALSGAQHTLLVFREGDFC